MFTNQPFNTRRAAAAAGIENTKTGVAATKEKMVVGVTTRASMRRNVLGDVSNVQAKAQTTKTQGKAPITQGLPARVKVSEAKVDATKKRTEAEVIPAQEPMQVEQPTESIKEMVDAVEIDQSSGPAAHKHEMDTEERRVKKTKTASQFIEEVDDLDTEDLDDPLMVAEYVVEIFENMRRQELETLPDPIYMDNQKELAWKMRSVLVDWLIEVHWKFKLLPETLYLSVNIIDRFLSLRAVSLVKLQLVGIAAMLIASKYEEVLAPSITNFVFLADGGYEDEEILKAERYVLAVLEFNLSYPNPMLFLRRNSKADNYDIQTRTVAKYLMEITLIEHKFLECPPSQVAAAALWLARKTLNRGEWNANLAHYSGWDEEGLSPCAELMLEYLRKPTKYEAVYKKYSSRKFMKASVFVKDYITKYVGMEN